jgi:DNA mismatch repair protein MutS2
MDLYKKSLITLELPAILKLLSAEAVSAPAKEAALGIEPSCDVYEIVRLQSETTAAKKMMETKSAPGFSGVSDITAAVSRADIGGMLNHRELMDVASVIRAVASTVSYYSNYEVHTAIDYLFSSLRPNKYLEGRISSCIISEDEMADGASAELSRIRRQMRIAGERVRQSLQKIITSQTYQKALQEPIITMRNGRYVVPVKAECKSQVAGLVHDISSTGATLFIEPLSVVQENNNIKELLVEEKREIDRILMELSAEVSEFGEDLIRNFMVMTQLDLIFAKAKLSYKFSSSEPEITRDKKLTLKNARHPLIPKAEVVPIDMRLGDGFDTLVITGPNTGGKTVSLKTLGLFCAMAECGLHIPADDGSVVPVYEKILADIGDEQSIEQSLSTFSSHMKNIVAILNEANDRSLLLFDELGAGTDPVEGAVLAISIIEYARELGASIAATTHYSELKIYATMTPGVINASCEFDIETLKPTYRLLIGVPGKSNAFAISKRLGIKDEIIEGAKKRLDSESASFEEVLEKLEKSRQQLERDRIETQKLLLEAREKNERASRRAEETRKERENAKKIARRDAERIIREARRDVERIFADLDEMRRKKTADEDVREINEARAAVYGRLNEAGERYEEEPDEIIRPKPTRPLKAGDRVKIISIGAEADVISINPDGGLLLQAGIMKVQAKPDEVILLEGSGKPDFQKIIERSEAKLKSIAVKPEIDLRGLMADEALLMLERYIDSAQLAKLNTVTVIHGKGTGALRHAVQKYLDRSKQIKSHRLGRYGEGESGVTIVELK